MKTQRQVNNESNITTYKYACRLTGIKVFHSAEMSRAGESSYSYKEPFYGKHIPLKIEKQSAKGVR